MSKKAKFTLRTHKDAIVEIETIVTHVGMVQVRRSATREEIIVNDGKRTPSCTDHD